MPNPTPSWTRVPAANPTSSWQSSSPFARGVAICNFTISGNGIPLTEMGTGELGNIPICDMTAANDKSSSWTRNPTSNPTSSWTRTP